MTKPSLSNTSPRIVTGGFFSISEYERPLNLVAPANTAPVVIVQSDSFLTSLYNAPSDHIVITICFYNDAACNIPIIRRIRSC